MVCFCLYFSPTDCRKRKIELRIKLLSIHFGFFGAPYNQILGAAIHHDVGADVLWSYIARIIVLY